MRFDMAGRRVCYRRANFRTTMSRLSKGEREFVSGFGDELPRPRLSAVTPLAPSGPHAVSGPGGMLEIDARGISPPLPLLRAHRALRDMQPGQDLRVITSYGESLAEFQSMVKYVTNYDLLSQDIVGDDYVHVLRKRR
jgi:tRNA 2-thiouridine synthesizing protein A